MICKKNYIFELLKKAKQTFGYTPKIGWLCESLFRVYTSITLLFVALL